MEATDQWLNQVLAHGPVIMGVLNVTPDSFSDGGRYTRVDAALRQAETLLKEGACIIDVGGESSRPGAASVSDQEELDRVMPVIESVIQQFGAAVSIDTTKLTVMREAVRVGVKMINDINALRFPGALEWVASQNSAVCLMHMQGTPGTMQHNPQYVTDNKLLTQLSEFAKLTESTSAFTTSEFSRSAVNGLMDPVVGAVYQFLEERLAACDAVGIARSRVCIDPGFGFGKTVAHNVALLRHLPIFSRLQCPILVGLSRKSMIDHLLNRPVEQRLAGGLALAYEAVLRGASIIRTHDVAQTRDVLGIWRALRT